jgi:hypothetical protein
MAAQRGYAKVSLLELIPSYKPGCNLEKTTTGLSQGKTSTCFFALILELIAINFSMLSQALLLRGQPSSRGGKGVFVNEAGREGQVLLREILDKGILLTRLSVKWLVAKSFFAGSETFFDESKACSSPAFNGIRQDL